MLDRYATTLTGKLAFVVTVATVILTPATFLVLSITVAPSFSRLEQAMVQSQVERVQNGIDDFGKEVLRATRDYADWDDSYKYLESPTKTFEQETLSPLAQQNLDVQFFGYVRFSGEVVRGEAVNLATGTPMPTESLQLRHVVTSPLFLAKAQKQQTFRTFAATPMGIYALATGWIRKSDGSGTPTGFVVMGRRMESSSLTEILRVPVRIEAIPATTAASVRKNGTTYRGSTYFDDVVESYEGLWGPDSRLVGKVRFSTPRSIRFLGNKTILIASSLVLAVMVAILILLSVLLRRVAIRRLELLAKHMQSTSRQTGFVPSQIGTGNDEIAYVARTFDETFQQLRDAREQLREQSYIQGQADLAAGSLHNLSNALGPVRVLQQKWILQEQAAWMQHLARAVTELKQEPGDPRKAALEAFVLAAADRVVADSEQRAKELEESRTALDQAIAILTSENEIAHQKLPLEPVDLIEMLSVASVIARHYGSGEISVELPVHAPLGLANKLQLGQLLGNLFKNAAESLYALDRSEKWIRVSVVDHCDGHVSVLVTDNGEGFDLRTGARLFERGFSTRRDKIGGLGLHWCANSAAAMGGRLKVSSDGKGCGATAALTLPVAEEPATPGSSGDQRQESFTMTH